MSDLFSMSASIDINGSKAVSELNKLDSKVKESGKTLEETSSKSGNFGKVLGGLGGAIASTFSLNAVKNFATECVQGLDDIYRSNAKLEAIFKSTGKATKEEIDGLKEYATSLEGVGVVDDDVTKTGMAQLATFNLRADSIKTLSSSMLDLIVNQKGVNATQEDAMGMANLIGKVMTGQTSALSRYGITLSESQEQVLKFGTEQERASMLSEVLGQNIGGVNEALSKTPEGKMKQMQMSIDGLKDSLGEALLPIILKVVDGITALATWFGNLSPNVQKVVLIGGLLVALLPGIIGMFASLTTLAGGLGISIGAIVSPVLAVIGVITAVIAIGVLLYKNWDTITEKFKAFDDFLTNIFETDFSNSFGAIGDVINAWLANVKNVWDSVKTIFSNVIDFVKNVFAGDWKSAWENIKNIFGGIFQGLGALIKAPLNLVIGIINGAISGINRAISFEVPDWVPFLGGKSWTANIPKMEYLENGGILTQPTMLNSNVIAGEKNKGKQAQNEVVIPLDTLLRKMDALANRPVELIIDGEKIAYSVAPHQGVFDSYRINRNPRLGY